MYTFGDRLRRLRLKSGLSQEAAAERLQVSPQAVSKWETDKCLPELSLALPLARLYGVSADELLGNEDRRAYWEEQWQEALRRGGEAATLPVTEAALKELPKDWQFRYRQGCTEFFMSLEAETEEDKQRWLTAAEKHLCALYQDEPMNESAGSMLVTVLMALDRRQEAVELCRSLPGGERQLASILEGEEQKRQYRRVVTASFRQLLVDLVSCETPEALEAVERIVKDVLGAEGFYADMLSLVYWKRAVNALEAGQTEEAMLALSSIRDLTERWSGAGGFDAAPEAAPFLEPHVPLRMEEHLWNNFSSLLQSRVLDPLRERPDFRALLEEAKQEAEDGEEL